MRQNAQLESSRKIQEPSKRELVCAIKCGRSEVAVRKTIVEGADTSVLIRAYRGRAARTSSVFESGKSVRSVKVQRTYASEWVLHILQQFDLRSVINGPPCRLYKV